MKMKYLVCFLVLLLLFNMSYAAGSVDIRSSLISNGSTANYDYDSISGNDSWEISPMNWGAFYYKINSNESTEVMYVYPYNETGPMVFSSDIAQSIPQKIDIIYETVPLTLKYGYGGWSYGKDNGVNQYGVYTIVNFFSDTYVAISPENYILNPDNPIPSPLYKHTASSDKLAKLVMNDDDLYQLKTGEELPLGSGYTLIPEQIDVKGKKAKLNLFKDGKLIGSSIVNTDVGSADSQADTMILKQTVLNESDIQIFRVRAAQVFQGTSDSIVEIEGIWLIDPDSAFIVDPDEDFGEFEPETISSTVLRYKVDQLPFIEDKVTSLGKGISLETLEFDTSATEWGFFLIKEQSAPKKYEIRSHILTAGNYAAGILPSDFAGFYISGYSGTEEMNIASSVSDTNRAIPKGDLTYNSTPLRRGYPGGLSDNFYRVSLFGQDYVTFSATETNKVMELVTSSGTRRTLATGQEFNIGNGYTLVPNQIDVGGKKAHLEIFKDGKSIGSSIVDTQTNDGKTWTLNKTVLGKDTAVAKVYVDSVFQGTNDSLLEIRGIWMADYTTAREIKTDDDFGKLEYAGLENVAGVNKLVFKSNENLTLEKDKTIVLTDDLSLKIANNNTLRFYLFTTKEVKSETSTETPSDETVTGNTSSNQTPSAPQTSQPTQPQTASPNSSSNNTPSPYGIWIIAAIGFIILFGAIGYIWMKNKKQ
jgi:S-layer-related duplication domain